MNDTEARDALFRTVAEGPEDGVALLALADWYEEHDDLHAADCLRWTARRGCRPFHYHKGQEMALTSRPAAWREGWYWWVRANNGRHWGCPASCQLPPSLWDPLRHTFPYTPIVFKEYPDFREAYEALFAVWPGERKARHI